MHAIGGEVFRASELPWLALLATCFESPAPTAELGAEDYRGGRPFRNGRGGSIENCKRKIGGKGATAESSRWDSSKLQFEIFNFQFAIVLPSPPLLLPPTRERGRRFFPGRRRCIFLLPGDRLRRCG